jgi:hypothetical protein
MMMSQDLVCRKCEEGRLVHRNVHDETEMLSRDPREQTEEESEKTSVIIILCVALLRYRHSIYGKGLARCDDVMS